MRVPDRILTVNVLLENANGDRRLIVHPRCKEVIKTLQFQQYMDNGEPDKKSGTDHAADALGYMCHQTFPIRQPVHHYRKLKF